jgi:hypothetical protein
MLCIFIITDFKTRRIPLTSLEKEFLKKRIKNYISKKKINFFILTIFSEVYLLIDRSFNVYRKISFKIKNLFYRYILKKNFLYSKNRKKFPNILIANKHI